MPKCITKPIVCICGSRDIDYVNFDLFLHPANVGCICTGGARGIDSLANNWAKKHKIESVIFLPQWKYYGKRAGLVRNREMVEFSDVVVAFWNGHSKGTLSTIKYAQELGVPCYIHLIQSLD